MAWCRLQSISRAVQDRAQPFTLLFPSGLFGLRLLFDGIALGIDGRGLFGVLAFGQIKIAFGLLDGRLTAFAFPLSGGLLFGSFEIAAAFFPLIGNGSPALRGRIRGTNCLGLQRSGRLPGLFGRFDTVAETRRQVRMLSKWSVRAERPL